MATPNLRRDTGPGAEGWLATAPPDLAWVGYALLGLLLVGAAGVVAIGFLLLRRLVTR
jgi:hypothetical protein